VPTSVWIDPAARLLVAAHAQALAALGPAPPLPLPIWPPVDDLEDRGNNPHLRGLLDATYVYLQAVLRDVAQNVPRELDLRQIEALSSDLLSEVAGTLCRRPSLGARFGCSDARIIMGQDEDALLPLWQEKRGEAEPEDLSRNLVVQLGSVTEDLNRRRYEVQTGKVVTDVQRRVRHLVLRWMGATLDGRVADSGACVRGQVHAALGVLRRSRGREILAAAAAQHVDRCEPDGPSVGYDPARTFMETLTLSPELENSQSRIDLSANRLLCRRSHKVTCARTWKSEDDYIVYGPRSTKIGAIRPAN
jgi:YqaJ-like recombinase protein